MSGKPSVDQLNKIDELVGEVATLRRELKEWKQELIEEFSELTGLLVEHFQQVIDRHLLNKPVEDYFDGQTDRKSVV